MIILPYSLKKSSVAFNKNPITNLLLTVLNDVELNIGKKTNYGKSSCISPLFFVVFLLCISSS
jgi:hypothetical protein